MSWPILIAMLIVAAIVLYVAVRVAIMAFMILWRALVMGMEATIEAAGPAIGGFFVQLGVIVMFAIGRGLSMAWAPVQTGLNRLGAKVADAEPETPAIADAYAEAVAVLGLPDNFTQDQVEAHWKLLVRPNHPDNTQGKSRWLATRINTARDFIFKHNGWKK